MESTPWEDGSHPDFLLSVNDRMLQVRQKLLEVAETRVTVVLRGEAGLGKEVLAHGLHRWSPRAGGPFVRVHCDAVSSAQLGGELFGFPLNGSLAPARETQPASSVTPFDRARAGTLYLRNVEALTRELGSRLAAELARREPDAERPRLVVSVEGPPQAATAELLESLLAGGAGVVVELPALRERPEDIGLLAQHLLQLHAPSYSTRIRQVRASLVELFKQHRWPGNVRELERVIRRFLVLEDETAIRRELEEKMRAGNGCAETEEFPPGMKLSEIGRLAAQRAEAHAIRRVLERTRWNKKAAAAELGVSYKSLLNKVRDYRLDS
ncbi:MAG: sigma-54-dependent transcriptional regulator [Gemmatimonadota bacterium]